MVIRPASYLVVRVQDLLAALPLREVVETMRPLAMEPVSKAPPYVAGAAIVRGAVTPVVDAWALFHGAPEARQGPGAAMERWVTLRAGGRLVALAVDEVIGVRALEGRAQQDMPPLLSRLRETAVVELTALDGSLLAVLEAGRLVPDALFSTLEASAADRP